MFPRSCLIRIIPCRSHVTPFSIENPRFKMMAQVESVRALTPNKQCSCHTFTLSVVCREVLQYMYVVDDVWWGFNGTYIVLQSVIYCFAGPTLCLLYATRFLYQYGAFTNLWLLPFLRPGNLMLFGPSPLPLPTKAMRLLRCQLISGHILLVSCS